MIRKAVFDTASGELIHIAIESTVGEYLGAGRDCVDLPHDLDESVSVWSNEARDYVADLDRLRGTRWTAVKAQREAHKLSGCETPSGRVDTTATAQAAITLAVLSATHDADWSDDWKMADNSYVRVDAAGMIAMGQAVMAFLSASQARGSALRSAIYGAMTPDDIATIDLTTGWPE